MSNQAFAGICTGSRLVREVRYFDSIDSTSDHCRTLAESSAGALHGLVVVAGHQTAGRGRHRRAWESPAGKSLLMTIMLSASRPGVGSYAQSEAGVANAAARVSATLRTLPMSAPVAVCNAAKELGADARIKYPNDVTVGGRKLSGILLETAGLTNDPYVLVGIGMNISQTLEELPPINDYPATSLFLETGRHMSIHDVLAVVIRELESALSISEPDECRHAFEAGCDTLGRRVRIEQDSGVVEGVATAIGDDGSLMIAHENGMVSIPSGQITKVFVLND